MKILHELIDKEFRDDINVLRMKWWSIAFGEPNCTWISTIHTEKHLCDILIEYFTDRVRLSNSWERHIGLLHASDSNKFIDVPLADPESIPKVLGILADWIKHGGKNANSP